jgi:2-dehydropantoate 2-reductase
MIALIYHALRRTGNRRARTGSRNAAMRPRLAIAGGIAKLGGRRTGRLSIVRMLILGAGGIGGYFGGRLAAAGVDVTFLVRPGRAAQLAQSGITIRSPFGDLTTPVRTVTRETAGSGYDVVMLACKAFDLDEAIDTIAPAADGAVILPQLNGLRHLDRLDAAFGRDRVLGGVAQVGLALEADGTIRHINRMHGFIFGERTAAAAAFCAALAPVIARGGFDSRHSADIVQDMWEKWVFICTNAAMSCLMRGTIGAVAATDHGVELSLALHDECCAVAAAAGHPVRAAHSEPTRRNLASSAGTVEPSMLRDLRAGGRVEAAHIVGDMLARALAAGTPAVLLKAAYTHLQVYEAQRQEAGGF